MQLLPPLIKAELSAEAPTCEECARSVLDVAPPVVRVIRKIMRGYRLQDLSVPQFRAMALLNFSPRVSLSCVADYVGTSLPAASRMIDGLVCKKLVEREGSSKDRRQVSLALTPRGKSLFQESRLATQRQLSERLASLSAGERRTIVQANLALGQIFGTDANLSRAVESQIPEATAVAGNAAVKKKGSGRSSAV
jgi:DNA-binding MarR family transcriptional regulator